jgi:predicted ribosome quality control (RQC) complex YloA/Tae2 family protein
MAGIQAIDATTLRALLSELRGDLVPSRFEKAQQSEPHTLQLALRSLAGIRWIELSWQAEAPRLLAIAAPPRAGEGSTLAQQLQHGLRGLALVAMEQEGWERVVELAFARRPGEEAQRFLVLELMGRRSNLFLLDGQRRVVAAGRQVRHDQSRLRPIGTGDPYQSPPPLAGDPPRSQESFVSWHQRLSLVPVSLLEALQGAYQGISPSLARQLVAGLEPEAGGDPLRRPVNELPLPTWQALHQRWQSWLEAVEEGRFTLALGASGDYRCWGEKDEGAAAGQSQSQKQVQHQGPEAPGPINRGLAAYYGTRLEAQRLERRRATLRQRLELAVAREEREATLQEERLAAAGGSETLRQQADTLLCKADPPREVVAEAQKLYHQARRLRRSVAAIEPRLAQHRQRLAWLETSLLFLEQGEGLAPLAELEEELDSQAHSRQAQRRLRRQAGTPQPLELRTPRGLRLQVGRNHRQNEWISLRQARRGDLWFHAQECPGSHVVLKASEAVSESDDRAAAADLAAWFSRARGNGRVPVVMVAAEGLQRIAGAGPGTVRHGGGEVLWGEPERARALLALP